MLTVFVCLDSLEVPGVCIFARNCLRTGNYVYSCYMISYREKLLSMLETGRQFFLGKYCVYYPPVMIFYIPTQTIPVFGAVRQEIMQAPRGVFCACWKRTSG